MQQPHGSPLLKNTVGASLNQAVPRGLYFLLGQVLRNPTEGLVNFPEPFTWFISQMADSFSAIDFL